MLRKVGFPLLIVGSAALLLLLTTRPKGYQVERSVRVAAPPAVVYRALRRESDRGARALWQPEDLPRLLVDTRSTVVTVDNDGASRTRLRVRQRGVRTVVGYPAGLILDLERRIGAQLEVSLDSIRLAAEAAR